MENKNQVDELGRRQGLWITYHINRDNILWKVYYLNGERINYMQLFDGYRANVFYIDSFINIIF